MYNRILKILVVAVIALQLTGCLFKSDTPSWPAGVVVNVLDKDAYDDCHIKGSINVEYDTLKEYAQRNWNKTTTHVVVYCSNFRCSASLEAAKILVNDLGFAQENVFAYEGGSAQALQEGVVMQGDAKESYLKDIHDKQPAESSKDGINLMDTAQLKNFLKEYKLQ